jgi:dinuclear metal center YbgI/SA1388 family protein
VRVNHVVQLNKIVAECDATLRIREIGDWDNALNGLQIENSGKVTKLGAAVDVSTRVLSLAAKRGINFLIVHHGLFWRGVQPVTGVLNSQLRTAFAHDIALYGAHLPLDVHPKFGNNALLAATLGLKSTKPFFEEKGQLIGVKARSKHSREEIVQKLERSLGGAVRAFNCGPKTAGSIGIITGAAGSEIYRIAEENIETFITGEAPHWAAVAAEELEINLLLGGHYATETFGVKAIGAHLSRKFQLPFEFIDSPTGL